MAEPSKDVADALRLVLLFFSVKWSSSEKKEWLRITGNDRATTKSLCDHTRIMLDIVTRPKTGRPALRDRSKTFEATKPWVAQGVSRATWYIQRRRARAAERRT